MSNLGTQSLFANDARGSAEISPCGTYRYTLTRAVHPITPPRVVLFVMLNPSTADAHVDDPTIRRCIGFARTWGASTLLVGNLFAFRSTDPRGLLDVADPVGPGNDEAILRLAKRAETVVCAWGAHAGLGSLLVDRAVHVRQLLADAGAQPMCLGIAKNGQPLHPLYLRADVVPAPYDGSFTTGLSLSKRDIRKAMRGGTP